VEFSAPQVFKTKCRAPITIIKELTRTEISVSLRSGKCQYGLLCDRAGYVGVRGLNPLDQKGNPPMKHKMCAGGRTNVAQCERSEQKMYVQREFFKLKKM